MLGRPQKKKQSTDFCVAMLRRPQEKSDIQGAECCVVMLRRPQGKSDIQSAVFCVVMLRSCADNKKNQTFRAQNAVL
jgi:hypothetical protein